MTTRQPVRRGALFGVPAVRVRDCGGGRVTTLAQHLTEAAWQRRITDYCNLRGLRWHHETDSRRSKAGFPDLVIVGPGGVVYAELKRETGRVTDEQSAWLDALHTAGQTAQVWRPSDWDAVRIELDRLAGAP